MDSSLLVLRVFSVKIKKSLRSHNAYNNIITIIMDVPAGNRQSVSTLLTFHHSLSIKTPGLTVFFPWISKHPKPGVHFSRFT